MTEQISSSPIDPQQLARNWQFDPSGQLAETERSQFYRGTGMAALQLLREPGKVDENIAWVAAHTMQERHDATVAGNATLDIRDQKILNDLEETHPPEKRSGALLGYMDKLKTGIDARAKATPHPKDFLLDREVVRAVTAELSEQEKIAVEKIADDRIDADRFPWTMPKSELPKALIEIYKAYYDSLTRVVEPKPDDVFHVGPPMSGGGYDAADLALFKEAGISSAGINFKRKDLQAAGIFFVNRIGAGEQPILGVPIPDPESEGGFFNVQDRSFLTREEFDKVYTWQQANGYGVGEYDPVDVQLDMFMSLMHTRKRGNINMRGGSSGRESKYGEPHSPYVDLGFKVEFGVGGDAVDPDGAFGRGHRRINTMSLHMINGHPDYPGTSEMFDDATSQPDQRYMTPGEFVKLLYQPLPTKEEALLAVTHNLQTWREREWVGRTQLTDMHCEANGIDPNDIG